MVQVALIAMLPVHVVVSVKSPEFVPVMLTEVIVSAAVPVFFTVTTCEVLATPTVPLPKLSEVGLNEIAGAATTPVPVSATVCGEPVALSATEIVADRAPAANASKVTLMVQVALIAMLPVHVVVSVKSPELVPVMLTEVIVSAAVPVFFTVTTCAVLATPTVPLPNASDVGLNEMAGAATMPVPVRATV
jgi:hypothetical protein